MTARRAALLVALLAARAGALRAQADPGGRWLTLETRHFHVHVRVEDRGLGVRAAAVAETVYAALAAELAPPSSRIELVVADNADVTNGAATVYPWPTALVYAVPPAADVELGDYDSWLKVGLAHELAHVFDLDLARGWWRWGRAIFGRLPALFPNLLLPDWIEEGIAVYYETRLTAGGRLRGSFHGEVVGARDAEAGPLPVDAAIGLGPRWPDGLRPYAFGSRFLASLRPSHPAAGEGGADGVVPRFIRETARRPIPYLGLNGALVPAAGATILTAWRRWQDSLARAARAAAEAHRGGVVVVRGLREPVAPRATADGRRIFFARDDGRDETRLAVLDRATGRVRGLARLNGTAGIGVDAVGDAVVAQLDLTDPYTVRSDLWLVRPDGREARMTTGARLLDPSVAPDGVAVCAQVIPGGTALALVDTAGVHVITAAAPGVEWAEPAFSPDGAAIAAVRVTGGRYEIVRLDREGRVLAVVARSGGVLRAPAFSADGRWVFWSDDAGGVAQIYATGAAVDTARWRVTDEPFGAYGPAPAGDSLFYLAYHHDGFALAAVPLDPARWTRGVPVAADSPPAAPAPVEGAAPAVVEEHPYRPWTSLRPSYWVPVVQAGSGAAWIGALTTGQDALGRHFYGATASLGVGAAARTWRGSLAYVYAGLVPWLLDASYSRDVGLVQSLPGSGWPACCYVDEDGTAGLTWRLVRWRTQLSTRLGAEYERRVTVRRAGAVWSAAAAHVVEPALAISPQGGWTVSALLRERWREDSSHEYHEARLAASLYRALPVGGGGGGGMGFARPVVALSAAVGELAGSERVVYGVGGVEGAGVSLVPGVTLGGGGPTFPVRGYPEAAILGRGAATGSVELRLPLALVGRGAGLLPLYLDRVSLALFADGGAAWFPAGFTSRLPRSSTIGSLGAELVADLGVPYSFPVRLRLGAARPLTAGTTASAYVAFGPSF